MFVDSNLEIADNVSVAAAAGSALIGDVIDLGANAVNPGRGQPMYMVLQVTEAFASGGSATVQFVLASDAAAAIATDGTATQHFLSDVFTMAQLPLGAQIVIALPQGQNYERYLGVYATTATATTTAGSVNIFLTQDVENWASYADAVN